MRARSIFYGTPAVSVPSLDALCEVTDVVGVVCQPDRPQGRGLHLAPPPVKVRALSLGLPVYQPEKVRNGELLRFIVEARADFAIVIAYGRILPIEVLGAPRLGSLNLHASLLPDLRGAAPIQRALMLGRTETGVCLMRMEAGLDTGPVLATHPVAIDDNDDTQTLTEKIGLLAAHVVRAEIPKFLAGELREVPQDSTQATYAEPITRKDTRLDPRGHGARQLHNLVRGLSPRPGAEIVIAREGHPERRLKILKTAPSEGQGGPPGSVSVRGGQPLIETLDGALIVELGQAEGKKATSGLNLVHGRVLQDGDRVLSSFDL
jgi:methionyl-tRNA formyltransferase